VSQEFVVFDDHQSQSNLNFIVFHERILSLG